jgi:hypothetical protein
MRFGTYPYIARFTVSSYPAENVSWQTEAVEHEFPYTDHSSYDEQREKALAKYEEVKNGNPDRIVTLSRVAIMDLEEGDITPTTLRKSNDPTYIYEGFAGI